MVRLGSSRAQCRETVGVARATLLVSACGLAAGLLISGCSSSNQTGLVNMWRDRYQNQPMSKLLIVGFQKDLAARRNWEDPFAEELRKQGVTAVPSYTLFPGDLPDTQQVVEAVGRDGYDGVVMTRPLSSTIEIKWVPGYVREVPSLQYATWSSVYHDYHRGVYEPDSVETHVLARYETDLWSTREQGRLVWTGTTEPISAQQVSQEISAKIVPELKAQGLLASR
jgi:hypothetical protein